MELLFLITAAVFLLLYFREHRKYKTLEKEYRYINSRFLVLAQSEENSYILLPTDNAVVKETAENANLLLEKFYAAQIDYNRSQKLFLQLFTNISHDLRTPITVLKGYIEMLYLQSKKEALSPGMQATLDKMQRNSKELADSVNNLFDMAKIRSGDIILQPQRINLTQIVHEIILEFYDLLEQNQFTVQIDADNGPMFATADREAVGRILKNLIDNAVKYGGDGKFLRMSLYENKDCVCIAVEDHGPGIPEKNQKDIFTRAYTSDRKQGNGLGLAISQGLAEAMGGMISMESLPGEKTIFTLTLQR